ncbi:unnamed protein product, partial [Didymodactylos carnosus]
YTDPFELLRCNNNDLPTIPHDKTFEEIPDKLCVTLRNNQFLQFDAGPGSELIIIFSSNEQLRLLEDAKGYFRTGPPSIT